PRRGEPAGQDHLERDSTIDAHLAGLVDNPHAAAPQFLEKLVVSEATADGWTAGRRLEYSFELLAVIEENGEFLGEVGMAAQEFVAVRLPSFLDGAQVSSEDVFQRVAVRDWVVLG